MSSSAMLRSYYEATCRRVDQVQPQTTQVSANTHLYAKTTGQDKTCPAFTQLPSSTGQPYCYHHCYYHIVAAATVAVTVRVLVVMTT